MNRTKDDSPNSVKTNDSAEKTAPLLKTDFGELYVAGEDGFSIMVGKPAK